MAKKQVDVAAADGAGKKKGKSNLVPAIVLAVGLLGGGYFMSGGGGGKAASAAAEGGSTTSTTKVEHGEVVKLDSITLNLADGRFVKLGMALAFAKDAGGGGGHGGGDAAFQGESAIALDLAISTLGDKTYAALAAPGGREHAKDELTEKVKKATHEEVVEIYFTEFVMQ